MKRPWSEYRHEPYWKQFMQQVGNADRRGIVWKLTYLEWWGIWERSEKWNERGRKNHQYCMCRHNHDLGYEIGNVYIDLNYENRVERCKRVRIKRPDLSKRNREREWTQTDRDEMRAINMGKTVSNETKKLNSQRSKEFWSNPKNHTKTLQAQRLGRRAAYMQGQALKALTIDQVKEIRLLKGKVKQRIIAEKFGISQSQVSSIQNYKSFDWLK